MALSFHQIPAKISARQQIINIYRDFFNSCSLPMKKHYWSLCGFQYDKKGSEIVQMVESGLLKKRQFYGVDIDPEKYTTNIKLHPKAHWFCGEWSEIIAKEYFNPGIVYLDTQCFANKRTSWNLVGKTMPLCPRGTILFMNVMLNDSRSRNKFKIDQFIEGLGITIPYQEISRWEDLCYYEYRSTSSTKMGTYVAVKET